MRYNEVKHNPPDALFSPSVLGRRHQLGDVHDASWVFDEPYQHADVVGVVDNVEPRRRHRLRPIQCVNHRPRDQPWQVRASVSYNVCNSIYITPFLLELLIICYWLVITGITCIYCDRKIAKLCISYLKLSRHVERIVRSGLFFIN